MKLYFYLLLSVFMLGCSKKNSEYLKKASATAKVTRVSAEERKLIEILRKKYFDSRIYVNLRTAEKPSKEDSRRLELFLMNSELKYEYKSLFFKLYNKQYLRVMGEEGISVKEFKEDVEDLYSNLINQFDEEYTNNQNKSLKKLKNKLYKN